MSIVHQRLREDWGETGEWFVRLPGDAIYGPVDFATPYLRQALKFVGITDVEVIAADRLNANSADSIDAARVRIADLIFTAPSFDDRAA